jgi:hypothetical protein
MLYEFPLQTYHLSRFTNLEFLIWSNEHHIIGLQGQAIPRARSYMERDIYWHRYASLRNIQGCLKFVNWSRDSVLQRHLALLWLAVLQLYRRSGSRSFPRALSTRHSNRKIFSRSGDPNR